MIFLPAVSVPYEPLLLLLLPPIVSWYFFSLVNLTYVVMSEDENDVCSSCDRDCLGGQCLLCSTCEYSYHFGDCSGIAESTYKSKGENWKKAWRCVTCRNVKPKGSQSAKHKHDDLAIVLAAIHEKLDGLTTLKTTVEKIEQSVELMSAKYDEILGEMRNQNKEIATLKKRVDCIESRERSFGSDQVLQELDDLEWQSRKLNLEFHGIPFSEKEDLLSKVNEVAAKIDVPLLSAGDVIAVHRLPAARDRVPGIIVRLARQSLKEGFMGKRGELRKSDDPCYILENLTKKTRALLAATKEWGKNHNHKYVWHRNNKIYVKRNDGCRPFIVRCESDLDGRE